MSLIQSIKQQLEKTPLNTVQHLVVAYSGGVDSHVLLHALAGLRDEFQFTLHGVHIHHGLSENADQWQRHCANICASLQVPFYTANVALKNAPRASLEAIAREARYDKIFELAPHQSTVVVAQHQDDQLETFLLQLKRGAGPKGLSGMNQSWQMNNTLGDKLVHFYRPLLDVKQADILDYATQHQLTWCEDESNQNTDFERNFLRQDILPLLQERWPELGKSVSRSAKLCAQQQMMLDEVCAEKLSDLIDSTNSLSVSGLLALSEQWLIAVVRYWLSQLGIASPSYVVLEQLKPQVLLAADDATPIVQWQSKQFRRFNQRLYVCNAQDKILPFSLVWQGEQAVTLPQSLGTLIFESTNIGKADNACCDSLGFDIPYFDNGKGPLTVKVGGYSQRFTPKGMFHSKPLKQWFKQWKVPPWQRESCLQLIQNEQVFAVRLSGKWILANMAKSNCRHLTQVRFE